MTDQDIFAFRPVPEAERAPLAAARRQRRVWPWVAGAVALLLVLAAVGGTLALMGVGLGLADGIGHGLHVIVNGDRWEPPVLIDGDGAFWATAVLGVAIALLVIVLVVPLALLLGLAAAALGIGIALLAVLVVAAVVLSPLWLLGLLLWLLLRGRRPAVARMPA